MVRACSSNANLTLHVFLVTTLRITIHILMANTMNRIYSATYSNVPVYEFNIAGNHVMRRRSDDWINATHILKVADYDKPARTRILEREVQKGVHEKVQGGYGKYQGTWIPLQDGRDLAGRNACLDRLLPIFDFVPGDRSPPPAPKHATAASNKPKGPRQPPQPRKVPAHPAPRNTQPKIQPAHLPLSHVSDAYSDAFSTHPDDDEIPDNDTIISDFDRQMQTDPHAHKRKRVADQAPVMSHEDQQHLLWSDELLDYFMLQKSDEPLPAAPVPPQSVDLNRPVDEKGNTPMHWAAAMADLDVVRDFHQRGARVDSLTHNGETALMRAVTFTNNFDRRSMHSLLDMLHSTAGQRDWFGSTVFHHIAVSTCSKSKYPCARYYLDAILEKLTEVYPPHQVSKLLDQRDHNGDTAILLAARYGARKCVRSLALHKASVNLPNNQGDTADVVIKELNARRRDRYRPGSSSPVQAPDAVLSSEAKMTDAWQQIASAQASGLRYASEAASLVSSQLPTLIAARTETLAAALDKELHAKEMEAIEAERLVEQRRMEMMALSQRNATLMRQDSNELQDLTQAEDLDRLFIECAKLVQAEENNELDQRLSWKPPAEQVLVKGNKAELGQVREKAAIARRLRTQQEIRQDLLAQMVTAKSLAGVGCERQDLYKRLITGALKIRLEDVESVLPEILADLETAEDDAIANIDGRVGLLDPDLQSETLMLDGGNRVVMA